MYLQYGGHNGINLNAGLRLEFIHYQLCECCCWMSALLVCFATFMAVKHESDHFDILQVQNSNYLGIFINIL
jgi:hypothetical protein